MAQRAQLVGRQAERERLGSALEQARLGAGSLLLIAGEAGVGKSRLAEEAAGATGVTALWGARATPAARPTRRSSRRCAHTCARIRRASTTAARCGPISP